MLIRSFAFILLLVASSVDLVADPIYNLNVQIVQVCDDDGNSCTSLGPSGGADNSYLYTSQVNTIWAQAGIQVTYLPTVKWHNTAAQRLTLAERSSIYNNTFATNTGDPIPALAMDAVQIFFVKDHSGTGYDGSADSGWVGNPLGNPNNSARNAGNAQLYIDGTYSSNGRSIMANEGFASDSLSGTLAHEIGHLLGLRHVENVNDGDGAGTVQDPDFSLADTSPNLMWGAGEGPAYNNSLTLGENYELNAEQIAAAIYNGTRLDPDGNGVGVLQAVPEPSSLAILLCTGLWVTLRRHRSGQGAAIVV
ncbi:MAG: hypothetical protein Aurels2KO_12990 [Aureliella sp.]